LTYNDIAIPFTDTSKRISILDVDQRTVFSLQTAIGNISGNVTGEESDPMDLFDESLVRLEPPSEIEIEQSKVIDKTLTSDIGWVPSPLSPPTHLNIYDGDGQLLRRTRMEDKQDKERVRLEGDIPWDATFSLSASYRPGEDKESEKQRLFLTSPWEATSQPQLGLSPPIIYNITKLNSSSLTSSQAQLEWNHTMEPFSLLYTVLSVWREDGSLYTSKEVPWEGEHSNTVMVEVEEEAVRGARVSLQNRVGVVLSLHGESLPLFPEEQDMLMLILKILALTILLILSILITAFCLKSLCKKSGRLDLRKQKGSQADAEPGTLGNYSSAASGFNETKPLMGNGNHRSGLPSDAGSDNTDQSLMSEEPLCNTSDSPLCSTPLPPSLLYPGDSMITLNKFNEDDDGFFLGGFNEDGSFIGDYMDNDPDTSRAVMNRLVGFNQLFSGKF